MIFKKISEIETYLNNHKIRQKKIDHQWIQSAQEFVRALPISQKNLESKTKIIHIAGTCGKGSTSHILSSLLENHNFKVGLFTSPHLFTITERIKINSKKISDTAFVNYFNQVLPVIESFKDKKFGIPSYFETLTGLALYIFDKENVDYIILETGLGGLYDATNIINDKLCILTKISMDHREILGNTINKIAAQKAGIIKKNNLVITTENQDPQAMQIIKERCDHQNATLNIVPLPKYNLHRKNNEKPDPAKKSTASIEQEFDFESGNHKFKQLNSNLLGAHQIENISLALTALISFSENTFMIDPKAIRKGLNLEIEGRFNRIYTSLIPNGNASELKNSGDDRLIILDGAHNICKMDALLKTLKELYPNTKFDFLVGFKKNKDYLVMIDMIRKVANKIIVTSYPDDITLNIEDIKASSNQSQIQKGPVENTMFYYKKDASIYGKSLFQLNSLQTQKRNDNMILKISDPEEALKSLNNSRNIVITGSFYLIGKISKEISIL